MNTEICYRPVRDTDSAFLYGLYASSRAQEMKLLTNWTMRQKEEFLKQQFEAQDEYYKAVYFQADFFVILKNEEKIGRLYIDHRSDEIRIIDIILAEEYRNRGIGRGILEEILKNAAQKDLPVRIHVEYNNPAIRLYRDLGFRMIEDKGVYYFLECPKEYIQKYYNFNLCAT